MIHYPFPICFLGLALAYLCCSVLCSEKERIKMCKILAVSLLTFSCLVPSGKSPFLVKQDITTIKSLPKTIQWKWKPVSIKYHTHHRHFFPNLKQPTRTLFVSWRGGWQIVIWFLVAWLHMHIHSVQCVKQKSEVNQTNNFIISRRATWWS